MAKKSNHNFPDTFPTVGMSRWGQFQPFSPISKERFRQLSKQGLAPQPVRLGIRCTMYHNSELHRWLADPVNYRADAVQSDVVQGAE
ncbi:MAG: hypothetical protein H6R07_528 [Proteobacteria bacterium]|nr:hypothetical protein [Pseudomonadota bacterium]